MTVLTLSYYPQNIDNWPQVEVYGSDFRFELLEMANAISRLELWEFFKQEPPSGGYMNWNNPNIGRLGDEIVTSHSGATFGFACRQMQYIAQNGFHAYLDKHSTDGQDLSI